MKKVAFITGATGGIGRAIAVSLAQLGYEIAIGYRSHPDAARELECEIIALGSKGKSYRIDMGSRTTISSCFDQIRIDFGRLDLFVGAAGVNLKHSTLEGDEAIFNETFQTNVRGLYFCSIEAARLMMAEKVSVETDESGTNIRGRIIHISAVTGRTTSPPGMIFYAASKAAVDSMTRGLAAELGPQGILVNAVAPGITATGLLQSDHVDTIAALKKSSCFGRLGLPSDTARAVCYLATDRWMIGQSLNVSGGRLI